MYNIDFLKQLDSLPVKEQYAKIILLSFDNQPMGEIQGVISNGNLNVNGSAAIRRTISLTMIASPETSQIENIENVISIDKKIKIEIGYKNPLIQYENYGDIVWFPCGVFIISSANISRSITGWTISITGKDKMVLLDGSVGGTLPSSVTFHERYNKNEKGDIIIEYPTIFQIIQESVNHYGGEPINNIIITDINENAKLLIKYSGETPIYFNEEYTSLTTSLEEAESWTDGYHRYVFGEDVGYKETDFIYPGELVLNAGETVVTLLDKISKTLGNFEFFYDIEGHFVFQQIKNYLTTGSPLKELQVEDYVRSYSNTKYIYSISDLDSTTSISTSPKYDNIKNDFIVWGERTSTSGEKFQIRYHLAIDTKPIITIANKYAWALKKNNIVVRYEFNDNPSFTNSEYDVELIGKPSDEWREELYRQALVAQITNGKYSLYDAELIAEWRKLYDTLNKDWKDTGYWNPIVYRDPAKLDYWLDFIDTGAAIGKYSVNMIGRRTKVINSEEVRTVYNKNVPDIVFIESPNPDKIAQYNSIGQKYFILTKNYENLFQTSATGASAFDKIRELLYQHLNYNTTITLNCLPKYYLEPNNIIYIQDKDSGINGNYIISQFSLPLTYNGTMSITATELLSRI